MLKIETPDDRSIVITRAFAAPKRLVFEAWTKPALVKRWLGVFGGWTFDVCEMDVRVGGNYRWRWRGPNGEAMGVSGEYREVVEGERIVATERFDQSWYPGDAVGTTEFFEDGSKQRTRVVTTVRYASTEARDIAVRSPMEHGMEAGYQTLDAVLAAELAG